MTAKELRTKLGEKMWWDGMKVQIDVGDQTYEVVDVVDTQKSEGVLELTVTNPKPIYAPHRYFMEVVELHNVRLAVVRAADNLKEKLPVSAASNLRIAIQKLAQVLERLAGVQ